MNMWLWALVVSVGVNLVMFIPAYIYKTDKLTDISYAATFTIVAIYGYFSSDRTVPKMIAYYMVLLWALRLGSFLFARINKKGKDKRFDKIRDNFWAFGRFWLLQGITVYVVMLAALTLWNQPETVITFTSILGVTVFAIGLALESIADSQKSKYVSKSGSGKWIDIGVWRASRHPNYLGEIMVWLGIYFFAFPSLSGWSALIGLLSPVFITLLLVFVSGLPLLEKSADQKWGKDKSYQQYKREVPRLLPTVSSLRRLIFSYLT